MKFATHFDAERILAANNPGAQKSRPHTLFASGPPSLQNVQANGVVGGAMPPRPFANGAAPGPIPAVRPAPPPPQAGAFPSIQVAGQAVWQGQPPQLGQGVPQQILPPPSMLYRPPPPNMPPPPQVLSMHQRPPPPPMGMGGQPPVWQPPPPLQQQLGRPPMQHMGMAPPPPPSVPPAPPS